MIEPTSEDVLQARGRISQYVHNTPVLRSKTLDHLCKAEVFFKCENFQKTGSFKIRGATNAILSLPSTEAARGVATHSSGNHAAALAFAAQQKGIKAYVVMPKNAPPAKKAAVAGYGAEMTFCEPTMEAREKGLEKILQERRAVAIHPYNDPRIIAGQGSAALELCESVRDLDAVIAPVGGGGLLSGTAIAVAAISPRTKVFGAEPQNADDAARSFRAGRIMESINPDTIADGLRTGLGSLTFPIIKRNVADILTGTEEAIIEALRLVLERMKILIEPSAAVPLAALLNHRPAIPGEKIGIIFSGGNIDVVPLINHFGMSGNKG